MTLPFGLPRTGPFGDRLLLGSPLRRLRAFDCTWNTVGDRARVGRPPELGELARAWAAVAGLAAAREVDVGGLGEGVKAERSVG